MLDIPTLPYRWLIIRTRCTPELHVPFPSSRLAGSIPHPPHGWLARPPRLGSEAQIFSEPRIRGLASVLAGSEARASVVHPPRG